LKVDLLVNISCLLRRLAPTCLQCYRKKLSRLHQVVLQYEVNMLDLNNKGLDYLQKDNLKNEIEIRFDY
jgi:hypothetical protein